MNRRHFMTLTTLFALAACSSEEQWNQRLTVIVDTPAGEVLGSSVTMVKNVSSKGPLVLVEARGTHSRYFGEAVVVEVTPGRFLFVLLKGEGGSFSVASHWAYAAFGLSSKTDPELRTYEGSMAKLQQQPLNVPTPLPPASYPLFVTFDDITRPETVRRVDPDNLASVFGKGFKIKSVTLEITDDAMTEGKVQETLIWINDPLYRANPYWSSLSSLAQTSISQMKTPKDGWIK